MVLNSSNCSPKLWTIRKWKWSHLMNMRFFKILVCNKWHVVFKKSFKSFILRPLIMIPTGQRRSLTNLAWCITKHLMKVTLRKKKGFLHLCWWKWKTQEPKKWLQSLLLFDKELSPQLGKALMSWEI